MRSLKNIIQKCTVAVLIALSVTGAGATALADDFNGETVNFDDPNMAQASSEIVHSCGDGSTSCMNAGGWPSYRNGAAAMAALVVTSPNLDTLIETGDLILPSGRLPASNSR